MRANGTCPGGDGNAPDALVVFDLDDTLIDTRGLLLPDALRRVARAAGVPLDELDPRGKRIEEVLRPVRDRSALTEERVAATARAWYSPAVPPLEPVPSARRTLDALRGRAVRALVTRGDPARQKAKIDACGLGPCFDAIRIRAIEEPGSKRDDFVALMERFACPPGRCAAIGDDERDELVHARALGWVALKVPDVPLDDVVALLEERGVLARRA